MCKPASEGGQRCAAHTRKALAKAQEALDAAELNYREATVDDAPLARLQSLGRARAAAQQALFEAQVEHASTPTGQRELRAALAAAEAAGATFAATQASDLIQRGNELRERNQAIAAALKDAAAKKNPQPQAQPASTEVPLDQIEPGDRFYWDGEVHVLDSFESDPDDEDMWLVETAQHNLSIPKSDTVETVEDDAPQGETFEERFAAARDEEAQVTWSNLTAPAPPRLTKISEGDFENTYGSILQTDTSPDANSYWDEPPAGYPVNQVWTVVEGGDSENHYLVPGIHRANRIGYIASKTPWTDPNIEVLYFDYSRMEG